VTSCSRWGSGANQPTRCREADVRAMHKFVEGATHGLDDLRHRLLVSLGENTAERTELGDVSDKIAFVKAAPYIDGTDFNLAPTTLVESASRALRIRKRELARRVRSPLRDLRQKRSCRAFRRGHERILLRPSPCDETQHRSITSGEPEISERAGRVVEEHHPEA
jgi:hypothetical protein